MTVNAQLPAIEALIAACEASVAQLRLQAPPLDLIENARDELEAYRRMSRLLRTLGARQRPPLADRRALVSPLIAAAAA